MRHHVSLNNSILGVSVLSMLTMLAVSAGFCLDEVVQKKSFRLDEFTLVSGERLAPINIGYETYGRLAPRGDNAILVCHFFSGSSHAAGRYSKGEEKPGYWDSIIGPGRALDTDTYFIVSIDTLCNIRPGSPTVVTTGPATVNPATGKPYGMNFPVVTIRDFVTIQYELLKSLGITRLKAVTGASMGGLQTFEWAMAYPDFVERVIPVTAGLQTSSWMIGWSKLWEDSIKLNPQWNNGNYYDSDAPLQGIACSLFDVSRDGALGKFKGPILMIGACDDLLFPAIYLKQSITILEALGNDVSYFEIKSGRGHVSGIWDIASASEVVERFLKRSLH